MGALQTIRTESGEELVVLTRRDYDALLARGGDPEAEGLLSGPILAAAFVSTAQPLPVEVWGALEEPANAAIGARLLLLRKARGLTQRRLAQAGGVEQSFISAIETGAKTGSPTTHQRLA